MRKFEGTKKLLAFLLAFSMVLQFVPMPGFAAEGDACAVTENCTGTYDAEGRCTVCGETEPGEAPEHIHVYDGEAQYAQKDETVHTVTRACTACEEKPSQTVDEAHVYTDGVCACGKTEPVTEEEPEKVCTCESTDPGEHAPFCAVYVRTNEPCRCVLSCLEEGLNEFCETCWFEGANACTGGEEEQALFGKYSAQTGNCMYTYDSDAQTLTISARPNTDGRMPDYAKPSERAWHTDASDITKVIVEDGVTYIGQYAFVGCNLSNGVSISPSVTSIGKLAFQACGELKSIVVPNGVSSIGIGAFADCKKLTNVVIPASVTSVDHRAFRDCPALSSVTYLGTDAITSPTEVFENCTKLNVVNVPKGYNADTFCGKPTNISTYKITIASDISNGTVVADKTTASEGDLVALTVTPDTANGYTLEAITVTRAGGAAVSVTADHKFTMPASDVTVTATFRKTVDYGIKIGGKSVTNLNTSGENWSYDHSTETLSLTDGFHNTIDITATGKTISVSGTVTAGYIHADALNLTIQGSGGAKMIVTDSGIEVNGSSLKVEYLTLEVTNSTAYGNGIVVGTKDGYNWGGEGKLEITGSHVEARSTAGDNSGHGILAYTLVVNNSYVYGKTLHTSRGGAISTNISIFSTDSHVTAEAVTGQAFVAYDALTAENAYFYNRGVDGSTLERKTISGEHYTSLQTFQCLGKDHVYRYTYAGSSDAKDETKHELRCSSTHSGAFHLAEAHEWEYSANADTIAAFCGTCGRRDTLKLVPPANLVSNGTTPREATVEGSIPGVATPEITYGGFSLSGGKPAQAGQYTASIAIEGVTASISFTLTSTTVATVTKADGTVLEYHDLGNALYYAEMYEDSTLTLLMDQTPTSEYWLNNCRFTLDLNGYSIINSKTTAFRIQDTAELTVKDSQGGGMIYGRNANETSAGSPGGGIWNNGKLTIQSGTISYDPERSWSAAVLNNGELIVEGGQLGTSADMWVISNGVGATATINGGTIKGKIEFKSGEVTIHDGTFEAKEHSFGGGTVTIDGGSFENGLKISYNGWGGSSAEMEISDGVFKKQVEHSAGTLTLRGGIFEEGLKVSTGTIAKLLAPGYCYADIATGSVLEDYADVANQTASSKVIVDPASIAYQINIDPNIGNGTVTADKTSAKAGETVTLTVTPAAGYELDTLVVKYADNNSVPVADNAFTMPAGDVTVTATFKITKVYVDGITIDASFLSLPVGTSKNLLAAVTPDNASDRTLSWTSSNDSVATVTAGANTATATVTAVKPGTGTVTVKAEDGSDISALCTVQVSYLEAPTLSELRISGYDYSADGVYWFGDGKDAAVVMAPDGYGIATASNGTYGPDITLGQADSHRVYLKRTSDGALTDAINLSGILKWDTAAPTGTVKVGEKTWDDLRENISFVVFSKEARTAAITAMDTDSGVKSIEYYVSEESLSKEELAQKQWTAGESAALALPGKHIVYARITDNVGNETYLSSDGIVLFRDSTADIREVSYTYKENADRSVPVRLYGNTIKAVTLDGTDLVNGTDYTLSASENASEEEILLKGTFLDTLDAGEYYLSVSFNPLGETMAADSGVEIAELDLKVSVAQRELTLISAAATDRIYEKGNREVEITAVEIGCVAGDAVTVTARGILASDAAGDYRKVTLSDVMVSGADAANYVLTDQLEINTDVTISPKSLNHGDITLALADRVIFGGNPVVTVKDGTAVLEEDKDFTLKQTGTEGECSITVTGKGNYRDEADMTYLAVKLPDPNKVKPDDKTAIDAYDRYTELNKTYQDEELAEKLEELKKALTAYDIIEGHKATYTKGSGKTFRIIANGYFGKFTGLKVDGKLLDSGNYTVKSGSTVVTLKNSYLDRLSDGKHTIEFLYTDGTTGEGHYFRIASNNGSPFTGDNSHLQLLGGIMMTSLLCMAVMGLCVPRKKGKYQR